MYNLSPQLDSITAWKERHFLLEPLCFRAWLWAGSAMTKTSLCVVFGCFSFQALQLVLPGPKLFGSVLWALVYLFWLLAALSSVDDRRVSWCPAWPADLMGYTAWLSGCPAPGCPLRAGFVRKFTSFSGGRVGETVGDLGWVQHKWVWVPLFSRNNNNT